MTLHPPQTRPPREGSPDQGTRADRRPRGIVRAMLALAGTTLATGVAVGGGVALGLGWWATHSVFQGAPRCEVTVDGQHERLDRGQAATAAHIAEIAAERGLPPRAVTIALATGYQESKLRNLPYGDRDSLGVFQQRPSQGWGTADQIRDVTYATNAFFGALVEVPGYQTMPVTEAAQAVQRSAYPDAYADHEAAARAWASVLTGYTPHAVTCVAEDSDLPHQTPRQNGFIPRAATAVADLQTHRAPWPARAESTSERTVVDLVVPGDPAATPEAWSRAAWLVVHAGDYGITEIRLDGWRWRAEAAGDGWVRSAAATGTIRVTFAND